MIHNILITNLDAYILYKRYFDSTNEIEQKKWEQILFSSTQDWQNIKNESHQIFQYEEKFVTYTNIGDLVVVFLTGSDDYDELGLSEILDVISEYLKESILGKSKQILENEAQFLENYDKLCIAIDEIISSSGQIDTINISRVNNMVALKEVVKKEKSIKVSKSVKKEGMKFSSLRVDQKSLKSESSAALSSESSSSLFRNEFVKNTLQVHNVIPTFKSDPYLCVPKNNNNNSNTK